MNAGSRKNPKDKDQSEEEEEEIADDNNLQDKDDENEEEEVEMDNNDEEYVEEEVDDEAFDFDEEPEAKPTYNEIKNPEEPIQIEKANENKTTMKLNVKNNLPPKEENSVIRAMTEAEAQENIKKLLSIDLESTGRDEIVDLLMKIDLKNTNDKDLENIRKRKFKKKYNVQSHYNLEKLQSEPQNFVTFKATMKELREIPEPTPDFNTAIKKLKQKMMTEPEAKDNKIYKILFSDKEKNHSDIERLSSVKTDYIGNKVKEYLIQKQKKIENITEKINEEMKQKCTFNPEILNTNPEYDQSVKRSLEQFLEDQNKHKEKIEKKVEEFQKHKEKENQQMKDFARPKINPNSQKIFEEKFKSDDKPFERLYKKRFGNSKTELIENSGMKGSIRSYTENKFPYKKLDKIEEFLIKKEKEKQPITKKEAAEHAKKLYEISHVKTEKLKKLKTKVLNQEGAGILSASYESNKFVLKNVMKKFKEIINSIFADLIKLTGRNTVDFNMVEGGEDPILNQIQLNRVSLIQLNCLLQQLGFITGNDKSITANSPTEENINSQPESVLKLEEKKLVCEMWEALKDSEGFVNVDHLFIFILAVINLYEYYLYSSYKRTNSTEKSSIAEQEASMKEKSENWTKEKEKILSKISTDINSKIVTQARYCSFDADKIFMISFDNSKLINRDFNIFYINFMNSNSIVKKKSLDKIQNRESGRVFKPSINPNSEKLSHEYRKKLAKDFENSKISLNATGKERLDTHVEYLNKLIIKKKRNESYYAKVKEEILKNETAECTFMPKIIEDYPIRSDTLKSTSDQGRKMKVWEKLYKIGVQIVSNRKDVPKENIEVIINGKECSFRPNTEKPFIAEVDLKENIYDESYEILYNRLRNGRTERKVKDAVHEKWEFPDEYYEYLNKNKSKKNFSSKIGGSSVNNRNTPNTNPIPERSSLKDLPVNSDPNTIPTSEFNPGSGSGSVLKQSNTSFEEEKKDAIPLLIIDVNIRPGVKKKIYVFDGDTAEALAEKFSKEHNLDSETKSKLQILIQSHMSRLLMRIDEENQSISEKSSAYNLS